MKVFIVRFIGILFLFGLLVACQPGTVDQRARVVPRYAWPCSYVWPDLAKEPTRFPLTKPVCRDPVPVSAIRQVLESTVLVYAYRLKEETKVVMAYLGTGSVIRTDGTVITANHVIKDSVRVGIMYRTVSEDGLAYGFGELHDAVIVAATASHDAAVIRPYRLPVYVPPPLKVCRVQPRAGDVLWHVGYRIAWSVGKVGESPLDFEEMGETVKVHGFGYVTLGYFGDSGGPIFDRTGHLLGLYVALEVKRPMNGYGVDVNTALEAMDIHAQFESCD